MKKSSKKVAKKVPFSKLSKPQKRIAIAKDVLAQIKSKKYIARHSAYVKEITFTNGDYIAPVGLEPLGSLDIQKEFKNIKNCQVCALGACLMSATKFANKIKFDEVRNINRLHESKNVKDIFKNIFSAEQILLIETAFESDNGDAKYGKDVFHENLSIKQTKQASSFYERYEDDEKRLVAIMKNIIKNNGIFKP